MKALLLASILIHSSWSFALDSKANVEINIVTSKHRSKSAEAIRKKFKLRDGHHDAWINQCESTVAFFFRSFPKEDPKLMKVTGRLTCIRIHDRESDNIDKLNNKAPHACNSALTYLSDEYRVSNNDPKFLSLKSSCNTKSDPAPLLTKPDSNNG